MSGVRRIFKYACSIKQEETTRVPTAPRGPLEFTLEVPVRAHVVSFGPDLDKVLSVWLEVDTALQSTLETRRFAVVWTGTVYGSEWKPVGTAAAGGLIWHLLVPYPPPGL